MPDRQRDEAPLRGTVTQRTVPQVVITDARAGSSEEVSGRMRRYAITMAFRTACFISMVFVEGWIRWVLLAAAVFLPYIAVVVANQADLRSKDSTLERGAPVDAPQVTVGEPAGPEAYDVVAGEVVDDPPGTSDEQAPHGRVA